MGGAAFDRLRRIVVGVSAELAFRRLLSAWGVPHDTHGATPFTEPDRYDLSLGGRRCDLKSSLISKKEDIRRLRRQPGTLLHASALVPVDQAESERLGDEDIYLFAFVAGLVTRGRQDLDKALAADQPTYLIYSLPAAWARPPAWETLRPLSLSACADQEVEVELGGQGAERKFLSENLRLPPEQTAQTQSDFHALFYLHVPSLPRRPITLHSPGKRLKHIVQPGDWGNIWVYGIELILAGYMRRGEFSQRAMQLPPGSRVSHYARTRTHNLALPVGQLYPCKDLFQRVRQWRRSQVKHKES